MDTSRSDSDRPRARRAGWGLGWLFPIAVWAVTTLYLGGDLGKLADDLSQHQRNVATGEWGWPPFALTNWFWRPLHLVLVESLQTVLWNHDRINHAVSALVHGACVLVLYRALRATGRSRRASMAAGLMVLVYPASWEVVFWPAALSTGIATGLVLGMVWLVCWSARGRGGWLVFAALPVMGFVSCCFNEQSGAVTPALVLLSLACSARPVWDRGALLRAAGTGAASVAGCAVYATMYLRSATSGMRGTGDSLVPMSELGDRLAAFVPMVGRRMGMTGFGPGALEYGAERLLDHGWAVMVLAGLAVGTAGVVWWRGWMNDNGTHEPGTKSICLVALFGVVGTVLAWAPLAIIERYGAPSRAAYMPAMCVAFAVAAALDAGAARAARRGEAGRVARGLTAAVVLGVVLVGAVMMVGVQGVLRARWNLDRSQAEALRRALPDPPTGTVFLPLSMRDRPTHTGSDRFDQAAIGAFRLSWSAQPLVRWTYAREDIAAGACWFQYSREVLWLDADGVVLALPLGPDAVKVGEGRFRLPWERVVPFEIDEMGRVLLLSRVVVREEGQPDVLALPPLVARAVEAGSSDEREYVFRAWRGP